MSEPETPYDPDDDPEEPSYSPTANGPTEHRGYSGAGVSSDEDSDVWPRWAPAEHGASSEDDSGWTPPHSATANDPAENRGYSGAGARSDDDSDWTPSYQPNSPSYSPTSPPQTKRPSCSTDGSDLKRPRHSTDALRAVSEGVNSAIQLILDAENMKRENKTLAAMAATFGHRRKFWKSQVDKYKNALAAKQKEVNELKELTAEMHQLSKTLQRSLECQVSSEIAKRTEAQEPVPNGCIICMSQTATCAWASCGHTLVCNDCLFTPAFGRVERCPTCRAQKTQTPDCGVPGVLKLYNSGIKMHED